ncbi:MAG: tRNA (adenosine(37)-N6)-dimethylallyltransferase MiaA [Clostridia bacterium]|nr:tRNA (adenosine(37)-N6)-dimethylallyltransferase MiaA [Clostridia bacterium]
MNKKIKTVCIVGPTASGKTELAIEIAKRYNGEIVSADSMQLYKGIHIASAAPDEDEKSDIPHYLIEFLELSETFSVADYVNEAKRVIEEINSRGKLPVIVGGTGLYIDSLIENVKFADEKTDFDLREELENMFDDLGAEEMLKRLSVFDSETAGRLNPGDRRRIIRAFEVYKLTGKSISEQNRISKLEGSPYDTLFIGLNFKDREKLYERINLRVEKMLEIGLLNEAKTTLDFTEKKGAMQAIGHKEIQEFLRGNCSFDEAVEKLKTNTRHYAKRQLTWFNRNKNINWIYRDIQPCVYETAFKLVDEFKKQ